jgi:replicative DNA helicase
MNRDDLDAELMAELSVVGGLLMFPDLAIVIAENSLTAAHFTDLGLRAAFGSINALIEDGREVDALAVFDDMRGRGVDASLQQITEAQHAVASERTLHTAAKTLARAYERRALVHALTRALDNAQTCSIPVEAVDYAQSLLAQLQSGVGRKEPKSARDLLSERSAYYEQLLRGEHKVDAMPTHIPAIDKALNGGLQRGRLYILAARPSVGKSSFSIDVALRASGGGFPTLFLSLEMPAHEVIDRAVANLGKCSYEMLQTGKGASYDDWKGLGEGMDILTDRPLYIDDQGALTLQHIRAKAHAIKRRGLKLLVLDYLQLCSGAGEDNRNGEIETITKGLKALAKELDIAVVVLSQLNRKVDERPGNRPQLSDLRDSGAIEQDADCVLFLWRTSKERDNEIGLSIDKNRQGRRAQIALEFNGDHQKWGQSIVTLEERLARGKPVERSTRGFD